MAVDTRPRWSGYVKTWNEVVPFEIIVDTFEGEQWPGVWEDDALRDDLEGVEDIRKEYLDAKFYESLDDVNIRWEQEIEWVLDQVGLSSEA